jgi:two-component system sensor histidine kinase UhpB
MPVNFSPPAWWARLGLRSRLTVAMGIVLLAFALVSQGVSLYLAAAAARQDIARDAARTLDMLSLSVALAAARGDEPGIRALLAEQVARPSVRGLTWSAERGAARVVDASYPTRTSAPDWFRSLVDLPLLHLARPAVLSGSRYGTLTAAFDPGPWETRLWRETWINMLIAAAAFAGLLLAIGLVLHANLRALSRLPAVAGRFAAGDYGLREPVDPGLSPEVRELLAGLNRVADDMQATLRGMDDRQRALVEQLHFQQELLNAIPIPVFYKDCAGIYLGVNRAWEAFFGRPADAMVGRTVFDLYPECPEVAQAHDANDRTLLAQGGVQTYEIAVPAAGGAIRQTLYTKAVYRRTDGASGGIIGAINDVTDLRQVETNLTRIRQAVESTTDAIAICALDGRALFVNPAFSALTGFDLDAVNAAGGIAPAIGGDAGADICPLPNGGGSWEGEFQIATRQGGRLPVFMRANPIRDERGEAIGLMSVITDIRERKQAEALTHRFGRILDQSLNEIYVFDAASLKFTQVNLGARRNLGYSRGELLNMTPLDLKPHYDPDSFAALLAPLREGRADLLRFDTVHRRRDGSEYPVRIALQLFRDEQPQLFVAVVEDVSERLRAEEALRRNEEKYRALVETTNDWLWEVDADGVYTYASPRVRDILGYDPEEVVGRRPRDFMPPDEARRVWELFGQLAAERRPLVLLENTNLHKDGHPVVLETSGLPVFDEAGNWLGYRGIDRDITARKRAEAAYRESELRFRRMAGNVPGMVFQFALRAAGELSFQFASEGAWALCGQRPDALIEDAERFLSLLLAEDRARFLAGLGASVQDLSAWNWEGRLTVDGDEKWINWRASPHRLGDGTVVWDGVAINVTETRNSQAALEQSQRQLRALSDYLQTAREEEKAHIAREIHDELGGTLTALKMDAYWLGRRLPPELEGVQDKLGGMLGMIDGAVQTTRRICTELRPTVLDDLGLVAAIEWQVAEFEKRMAIRCVFQRPAQDVTLSEGMAVALFRILQESLTNVARHADAGCVYVMYQATDQHVCLAIEDNGRGIDPQAMEASRSHGLRGIRERVRQFGGDVDIIGEPGKGTSVLVQLPLAAAAMEEQT